MGVGIGQRLLIATKNIWTKHLDFCYGAVSPPFFEIYQKGLQRTLSVAFSKHVTHYGSRSGFPY